MGSPDFDYFGPPDALDSDPGGVDALGGPAGGGFGGTSGGEDLNGSTLNIQQDGGQVLNNLGLIGALLKLCIDLLIALGTWIADSFQGVPQQAKTIGTGQQLAHATDAVTQWIGFNLVGGGGLGRVLSEGNWPANFGGRIIAMGGALIEFANREPPGLRWHVRNTPPRAIAKFGDGPRQFKVGPIPHPTGAPYSQAVTIDGFFSERVRTLDAYKAKFGFDQPTPEQLRRFLHDSGGVLWNVQRVKTGRLNVMRLAFLDEWVISYLGWLANNQPIPPGPTPDPCGLPEDPPCPPYTTNQGDQLTDFIGAESTYLYYIARSLERMAAASGSPQDAACCANVVNAINLVSRQISTLTSAIADKPDAPVDLTGIIAALGQLLAAVQGWPALWGAAVDLLGGKLDGITRALGDVAKSADPSEISAQLKKWNEINDVPPELLAQMVRDKVVPPQYAKFMQGSPAEWIKAILSGPALISSPTDLGKLLTGDSSDLTGAPKAAYEKLVRTAPALFEAAKKMSHLTPKDGTEALTNVLTGFLRLEDTITAPVLKPLIEAIQNLLKPPPGFKPTIGNIGVDPDTPVSAATGVALSAAGAAWLLAFAGIDEGEPLAHLAELIAGAVGFEELVDVSIGPLVRNGIAALADMRAKQAFRQYMPGPGTVASYFARGLNGERGTDAVLALNGLSDPLIALEKTAAFHGMQVRPLLRMVDLGLFTEDDIKDELTFGGMRQASQDRLLHIAPFMATQQERGQLINALESAYQAGLLQDLELTMKIDSARHNVDRDALILESARLKKHVAIVQQMEQAYTTLYECGISEQGVYRANLEGLGLQPDKVNALMAVGESRLTCTLHREATAAERKLQNETVAAERKAAIENFKRGTIGIPALALALIATGLTSTQAAAWTDLIALQKAGAQRWVFGLQKTPEEATLLQARIAALTDQRKKEFINETQFVDALKELKIPAPFQNALLARANAGVSPKKDASLTPVKTGG